MQKSLNIKTINTDGKKFFTYWLLFLKPYHNLAPRQIAVMALLLYKRHELSKVIADDEVLDGILFSKVKDEVKTELGFSDTQQFNNMMTTLRKANVISKDNRITKLLIPNVEGDNFKLVFNFNIKW